MKILIFAIVVVLIVGCGSDDVVVPATTEDTTIETTVESVAYLAKINIAEQEYVVSEGTTFVRTVDDSSYEYDVLSISEDKVVVRINGGSPNELDKEETFSEEEKDLITIADISTDLEETEILPEETGDIVLEPSYVDIVIEENRERKDGTLHEGEQILFLTEDKTIDIVAEDIGVGKIDKKPKIRFKINGELTDYYESGEKFNVPNQGNSEKVEITVLRLFVGSDVDEGITGSDQEYNNTIIMKDLKFDPFEITIKQGSTITWKHKDTYRNRDDIIHILALQNVPGKAEQLFEQSPRMFVGDQYSYTFDKAGEYRMLDVIHSERMNGIITVEAVD